jgi:hypothetical protein
VCLRLVRSEPPGIIVVIKRWYSNFGIDAGGDSKVSGMNRVWQRDQNMVRSIKDDTEIIYCESRSRSGDLIDI